MQEHLKGGGPRLTYAPDIFLELRRFFRLADDLGPSLARNRAERRHSLPPAIAAFLDQIDAGRRLENIARHTASPAAFRQRFYRWFDAFQIMKFAHFARERCFPDVPVAEAAGWLLETKGYSPEGRKTDRKLLEKYRELARRSPAG